MDGLGSDFGGRRRVYAVEVNEPLEESLESAIDFSKLEAVAAIGQAVVPTVLQNASTLEVLFVGYVNELALKTSLREGVAVLWSTSRNELWRKGATSGDVLALSEVRVNCEQNSLLFLVEPRTGSVCHTVGEGGQPRRTCYYRAFEDSAELAFVPGLQ